jgi:hypothetical protein
VATLGVLLVLLALAATAEAQDRPEPPSLAVNADKTKVPLGEPFTVTLSVIATPETAVSLPAALPLQPAFGEVERREVSGTLPDGLVKRTFILTVIGFEVGKQNVPPLPVVYVQGGRTAQAASEGFSVEILSVVGDGKEELKPIAPPVAVVMRDWRPLWIGLAALGGVSLVVAAWFVFGGARRRVRRHAKATPLDNRPPEEIALEKLRALAASGMLDADDRRPFYFAVSEVMREFLGRRFGFEAMELTTAELLQKLEKGGSPAARVEVARWLEATDLIKYARIAASREDAERALAEAIEIVEQVGPRGFMNIAPASASSPPEPTEARGEARPAPPGEGPEAS